MTGGEWVVCSSWNGGGDVKLTWDRVSLFSTGCYLWIGVLEVFGYTICCDLVCIFGGGE